MQCIKDKTIKNIFFFKSNSWCRIKLNWKNAALYIIKEWFRLPFPAIIGVPFRVPPIYQAVRYPAALVIASWVLGVSSRSERKPSSRKTALRRASSIASGAALNGFFAPITGTSTSRYERERERERKRIPITGITRIRRGIPRYGNRQMSHWMSIPLFVYRLREYWYSRL